MFKNVKMPLNNGNKNEILSGIVNTGTFYTEYTMKKK